MLIYPEIIMHRIAMFLLVLFTLAACTPQRESRTLESELSAAGITSLSTHTNIGSITITPSPDASIHVSVKLSPSNNFFWDIFSHADPKAIRTATLSHTLDQGALDLGVQYAADSNAESVKEDWNIAVPANVHIKSNINIGKLQVTGIAGGVDAQLNIGRVTLEVPDGPLKVSMNVGKISARAQVAHYGDVVLAANVGDAQLTVNGMSVGGRQKQGTGSEMSYRGQGNEEISLKTNTGKVSLTLSGPEQAPAAKH
jgi:hypothetical protein